ncbi:glycoside hydrolase family 16 protein [Cognatilysobacter bugurensis]|uniref:GH16 domain-containing protein n=1 Tax=Cognatilysobacter bugurensis TaxID=543356 RepID=A0A918W950_9GAMM|nr:glycoside hydrolase family 16 protein [Lysobacter bugurensis]GHA83181.1 hypothetical protein GCM10007067_21620 [Lysobacter bugurensis]
MLRLLTFALLTAGMVQPLAAKTLQFAGHTWTVRDAVSAAPGPNRWAPENAWVDTLGRLHLRISRGADGIWRCAEVKLDTPLGFGTYEFKVDGRVDRFDRNVVFGMFQYPDPATGPDFTHEIDIEFSRWGSDTPYPAYWTVYPTTTAVSETSHAFAPVLEGDYSTHRFHRSRDAVRFQMLHGHQDGDAHQAHAWTFAPKDAKRRISQAAQPVYINLWLFRGMAPSDDLEVEVVVSDFRFIPAR